MECCLAQLPPDRRQLFEIGRGYAHSIATRVGGVTADDVHREMIRDGYNPAELGNAAGSLFRGKDFEFRGEWQKSHRVSNRAHCNRIWRLRGK